MQGISGMSAKNLNYFRMIPPIHHKNIISGNRRSGKMFKTNQDAPREGA
jgi:hypothetical protein